MELNPETIKALLDAFDQSDWREMTVTVGGDRLHVSRDPSPDGRPPAPAPPPQLPPPAVAHAEEAHAVPAPPPEAQAPQHARAPEPEASAETAPWREADTVSGTAIESPSVGLFWRAPAPGAPPFVEVGDHVAAGATVAIVEVMKLMNHVTSPVDGKVAAILVDNGAAVEFGQPLVIVDPEA
jgi:acetyl-CoA carboxylase biotin carboxyl carrier protein